MPRRCQRSCHGHQHLSSHREQACYECARHEHGKALAPSHQCVSSCSQQHQHHSHAAALELVAQRGDAQQAHGIGHLGHGDRQACCGIVHIKVQGNGVQQGLVEIIAASAQTTGQRHQ